MVVALIVLATAARGIDLTRQMVRDSRIVAGEWLTRAARAGDEVGDFTLQHQLPRMPAGVTDVRMRPAALADGTLRPAFLSIPLEDFEFVHEEQLPAPLFAALTSGALGYHEAAVVQAPRWFARRPATFVNPPIRVFVRADVWNARFGARRRE